MLASVRMCSASVTDQVSGDKCDPVRQSISHIIHFVNESAAMSETQETAVTHATAPAGEPLFQEAELEQFDADDTEAGAAIGKMLSFFFLYTIVVMSIAAWWTFASVAN